MAKRKNLQMNKKFSIGEVFARAAKKQRRELSEGKTKIVIAAFGR